MMYLATFNDAMGLPRAWGLSPSASAAESRARRELAAYRKGTSYDSTTQEPFSLVIQWHDAAENPQQEGAHGQC